MSGRKYEKRPWDALEGQTRAAFGKWASYRLQVYQETSMGDRNADGRFERLSHLVDVAHSPEKLATAWSATLDPVSSIYRAQYLASVLRSGEPLASFLERVNVYMQREVGILPGIRRYYESSQESNFGRRELLFRRYERHLPLYDIPANLDLMVESALYALYVAESPSSKLILPDNRKELWRALSVDEEALRVVTPRKFEELVAYIYEQLGCRAEVTSVSGDNGADVLAWQPGPFGTESLIVVQTKLYSGERRVDLAGVHALHGAVAHYNASHAHLVATTDVTGPARKFLDAQGYKFIDLSALRQEVEAILK
jgi:restriction system protein